MRPDRQQPSAYQQRSSVPRPVLKETPTSQSNAKGRRLNLRGGSDSQATPSRPVAERGTALFSDWFKSSGVTALAALAFVIGLFMLLAWATKRTMPKSAQLLPAEAVRILGRVSLGARQYGHLLCLGNKLVLVSISQGGVEKLAEVDDPQEVQRLVALCGKTSSNSSQVEFDQIFGQFAKEKAGAGFLGSEASLFTESDKTQAAGGTRHA